ncbi:tartrate-resistant acid phosphatase type 5-like [Ptychodera flava]|uniref:tartrate-resistant acid phosphatase type 5-like n=1 Tax=Ptychodera flava TaxID=63121 RepID=UPI003969D8B8
MNVLQYLHVKRLVMVLSLYGMSLMKILGLPVDDVFQANASPNSLYFTVIGDWGGVMHSPYTSAVEVAVAKAMGDVADLFQSEFTVSLGDNFYEYGVQGVDDPRFKRTFEDVFTAESLQNPWYILPGNHDYYGNVNAQVEYSSKSERWVFPSLYHSHRFTLPESRTTLLLVLIDTVMLCGIPQDNIPGVALTGPLEEDKATQQWQWIENTLNTSSDDYIVVAGHYPVWSIGENGPTEVLAEILNPILEKYEVTAYLAGHDHSLQHLREDNSSVEHFIIGSARLVDPSTVHQHAVPDNALKYHYAEKESLGGFAAVEVGPRHATLTFVDATSGKELYRHDLFPRGTSLRASHGKP